MYTNSVFLFYLCFYINSKQGKQNCLLLLEDEFTLSAHNAFLFPDADGPSMFPASVLIGIKISILFRGHLDVKKLFLNLKATLDTDKTLASYFLRETKTHCQMKLCFN